MAITQQRPDAIRVVLDNNKVIPATRVAAIIFFLYGTPIGRIVALRTDSIIVSADGMTIEFGSQHRSLTFSSLSSKSNSLELAVTR